MTSQEFVIMQTTTDTAEEADRLAAAVVEQQLAACVQVSQVTSYYRWQGEAQRDPEFLLAFKTTVSAMERVKEYLAANHSYEEPEVIVVPIVEGSRGYLQWMANSVSR